MRPRADTLLVWTGAPCSYGCAACPIDAAIAPPGLVPAELQREFATLPARTGRLVVLLGGEPLLRRDLRRLIGVIRAAGCLPGIVTTGRALVYPQVRERLRQAGLAYLRVQFFGLGEMHDHDTRTRGAFDQAMAGLQAWMAEPSGECDVDVSLTVRRRPMDTLVAEVRELARVVASPAVQIIVAVDSTAPHSPERASLRRAVAALSHWNENDDHPLLAWEGLPEPLAHPALLTLVPMRATFVAATPRASCLGAAHAHGQAPGRTSTTTRANSFNFVRSATTVAWTRTADACLAHSAAGGADPQRQVWLVEDDRLVLHETDTGDFTPAEITRVKDEWSHLFLDRAPAGVLDDFTDGMRRVLPDATCQACPHRTHCGRRFRTTEGPPFAREEAWIASYIGGLRGRVLDVGCGEQLYRDQLAPLIRSRTIEYTGLDPDAPSLARIRAALSGGRFILTGIEEFHDEPASYDRILCLRSLNHVLDVDEALARMAGLLAPGGQLLLVETTPFAMLRRPEQVAAADRAPRAGHQHFRNVSSLDVLPLTRRRALHLVEHHRAGLEGTNEWILLFERPRGGMT